MVERAFRAWSVAHECGHYWIDFVDQWMPRKKADKSDKHSNREARMVYRVADRHLPFARLLAQLDMPLAAVLVGKRFYLGVRCDSDGQARRRTVNIFRAVMRRPKLATALRDDLALWRARKLGMQLTLWWPAIELWREWLH